MKRLALLLISCCYISTVWASVPVIHLQGDFYSMGRQYANQNGERLLNQLELLKYDLRLTDPEKQVKFEKFLKMFLHATLNRYPEDTLDFIKGEAESEFAKVHDLTLDDFTKLDQQFLLAMVLFKYKRSMFDSPYEACSFIGVKEDKPIVGRNFDYPKDFTRLFTKYAEVLSLKHADSQTYPNRIYMLTWPGAITQATVVNDKGLYSSINIGANVESKYHILKRPSYALKLALEMMRASRFDELKTWINNTASDCGYNVNIAGPGKDELASMEVSPYNELQGHYTPMNIPEDVFMNRERLSDSINTIEPNVDSNMNYIVSTNTFRLADWEQYLGHDVMHETPGNSITRYMNLHNLLQSFALHRFQDVKEIIARRMGAVDELPGSSRDLCPIGEEGYGDYGSTYYSIVFDAKRKVFEFRLQNTEWTPFQSNDACASKWSEWQRVQM